MAQSAKGRELDYRHSRIPALVEAIGEGQRTTWVCIDERTG
jgi:hypothetical protein